jgi:predicted nucleic-acid-binding protein
MVKDLKFEEEVKKIIYGRLLQHVEVLERVYGSLQQNLQQIVSSYVEEGKKVSYEDLEKYLEVAGKMTEALYSIRGRINKIEEEFLDFQREIEEKLSGKKKGEKPLQ